MAQTETHQHSPYGRYAVAVIAFAACVGYLIQLGRGDVLSDEALIGFRSIGYLDFLFSEYQTTPLEWFVAAPPWWTRVWFHDHPPLVFLFQHFSFLLFGPTAFALRFPSAFAAAVSVFLIGAIAQRQWGGYAAGIMAALGLAVLTGHVSMARQGLQEAMLMALLLGSFYCATRAYGTHPALRAPLLRGDSPPEEWSRSDESVSVDAQERPKPGVGWWYGALLVWGLAFLTKLTAVGFVPALIYLIWRGRRKIAVRHHVGLAAVLFCFVAPLMIYNALLFRATGHFDFQFSYLFGQEVREWQTRPGRVYFPDFRSRLTSFLPHVAGNASLPMNAAVVLAVAWAIWHVVRKRGDETSQTLLIILASFSLLFLLTGPLPWFTYLLWPWLILLIARAATTMVMRRVVYSLIGLILVIELAVAWNTVYAVHPHTKIFGVGVNQKGKEGLTYLPLWRAHARWGYQEVEQYLRERLRGLYPGGTFPVRYPFLEDVRNSAIRRARAEGLQPSTLLLVYDTTMHQNALLWSLFRRSVYEGWPVLDVDTYRQMQEEQGENVFWQQGFKKVIFVRVDPASGILTRSDEQRTGGGERLEEELRERGMVPVHAIPSPKTGNEAFRVYDLHAP